MLHDAKTSSAAVSDVVFLLQFSHLYSSFLTPILLFSYTLFLMTHIFTCDSYYDSFLLYSDSCLYLLSFGICCTFTGITIFEKGMVFDDSQGMPSCSEKMSMSVLQYVNNESMLE